MTAKTIIVICLVTLGLGPFRIAEAQEPKKVPRIGFLFSGSKDQPHLESFLQALRDWVMLTERIFTLSTVIVRGATTRCRDWQRRWSRGRSKSS
jgi:hypothetical protein